MIKPMKLSDFAYDKIEIDQEMTNYTAQYDGRAIILPGYILNLQGHPVGFINNTKTGITQFPIPRNKTLVMDKAKKKEKMEYHFYIVGRAWCIQENLLHRLKENGIKEVRILVFDDDEKIYYTIYATIDAFIEHGFPVQEGHGPQIGLHEDYWTIRDDWLNLTKQTSLSNFDEGGDNDEKQDAHDKKTKS